MARDRAVVQALSFTGDGPILVAIHDVLADLYDLLDTRLSMSNGGGSVGPVPISEPAPAGPPAKAVPVSEPAPDKPSDDEAEPVDEPAEDLPTPPPTAGRGSSQAAWLAWARNAGVDVADDMTRDDIINACRSAGVIPEQ